MRTRFLSFVILISILTFSSCRNTGNKELRFNLDFEQVENGLATGWKLEGNSSEYIFSIDSTEIKSGKYSVSIESNSNDLITRPALIYTLPDNYAGKRITLSGYIKTENVTEGYAELLMSIEPEIASGEMYFDGITGTTDWKKYEITLEMYPEQTQRIVIGGALYGKGKMWLDDLKITIDGKNILKAQVHNSKPFPAKNDKEFDNGSNIVFPELTVKKIEDLELLGRIWGFLKYHHPAIAKGVYNFDNELFSVLPEYLSAGSNQQRDSIVIEWINIYGKISKCKNCRVTSQSAFLKPRLFWNENQSISPKLKDLLQNIYLNRNQGNNYYVRISGGGNPVFSNERAYENLDYPDAGFRLLALFRYWNMVNYFYPNIYLTNKDWDDVLNEYIPYFIETVNRLEYELKTALLISEICDSHAFLGGFNEMEYIMGIRMIPARVQFVENKLIVLEYYGEGTELKKGDIITHIEGKTVEAIVDSIKRYYPTSNEITRMRDISGNILRTNKEIMYINYISSSAKAQRKTIYSVTGEQWINYQSTTESTEKCYKLIDKDIGYIDMGSIKSEDVTALKSEFKSTKGIIIDIRNYPPIFAIFSLGSYFTSNSPSFAKATIGNTNNPGEFNFTPVIKLPESEDYYEGKLVVIINEMTQSMAEDYVMAFQAGDNTTLIGSHTAGADGKVSKISLPGGLETWISGVGFYYPDGQEIQRIGIIPDIEVNPTIKGIREGRDELVEKAIEVIRRD
ncbi:MAG: S41 family peptidase [Candidatus Saccharimonadaceae bacterium]